MREVRNAASRSPASGTPRPTLDWLPLRRLTVDARYQRELREKNQRAIRRIADEFDWAMFAPLVVAPTEDRGTFAIIDGQHRAEAARLIGLDAVPAMIVDIRPERQAAAFVGINARRKAVTPLNVFRAAMVAGEDWAVECDAAVRAAGCRLMRYNKSHKERKAGEVYAVALVRSHVGAGRAPVVTRGLLAIARSASGDDPRLYSQRVLRPWFAALSGLSGAMGTALEAFVSEEDLLSMCTDPRGVLAGPTRSDGMTHYQLATDAILAALRRWNGGTPSRTGKGTPAHPAGGPRRGARGNRPAPAPAAAGPEPRGVWTAERDRVLAESDGRYATFARLAEEWGLTSTVVMARWHLLRRRAA